MATIVIPSEVIEKEISNFQKWRSSKENPYKIQAREVGLYVAILKARGKVNELEKFLKKP